MTHDPHPNQAPSEGTGAPPAEATHAPEAVVSLKQAMRRARSDDAERAGVLTDLRIARIGRLELLHEALRPLMAQIPPDIDLFDVGLMPGSNPRLFVDMIGFVEMGRDARTYQLVQDTRHGRTVLAESAEIPRMVEAATDYVARRLLERDKALAADTPVASRPVQNHADGPVIIHPPTADPEPVGRLASRPLHVLGIVFAFVIDLLGSIAFFTILVGVGWIVWSRLHGQAD